LRHHFRVGLAVEAGTRGGQLGAQRREVLDDAVVNDGDAMTEMRMRIALRRRPMGRPPGVADADCAGQRFFAELAIKIGELAFGPAAIEMPVMTVATPAESYPRYSSRLSASTSSGADLALTNYPDYAAHAFLLGIVLPSSYPATPV
jgi:hypothetical protein